MYVYVKITILFGFQVPKLGSDINSDFLRSAQLSYAIWNSNLCNLNCHECNVWAFNVIVNTACLAISSEIFVSIFQERIYEYQ
jgi:hypothetical protein